MLTVVEPVCGASRGECNDDCNGLESGLVFEATEGETVFIVIEGYGGRLEVETAADVGAQADAATSRWTWLKWPALVILLAVPIWYLIGGLIYQRINDDPDFRSPSR